MGIPVWSTAIPDWEHRIINRLPLIPFAPLFPHSAHEGLETFKALTLADVTGKPTIGECCAQWVFDFAGAIFGSYDPINKKRLIQEYFLLISKKNSKALALDTLIPTPTGWKTMGELEVGDQVLGFDGKPCNVVNTSEIFYDHDCYELTFSNGQKVVADAGHKWITRTLQGRKPGFGVRTTQEIVDTLLRKDGAKNHSMPMPSALELPEIDLPIGPYTLGAWLGDGHSGTSRITGMDMEILEAVEAEGYRADLRHNNGSKAWTYVVGPRDRTRCCRGHDLAEHGWVSGGYPKCKECERLVDRARRNGAGKPPRCNFSLYEVLRDNDLLGNKHIPEVYLRASFEQRLNLLQGLMDTDGTISKAGTAISFVNTNPAIVDGLCHLLSTFGIKFSVKERDAVCNGRITGKVKAVQFHCFRDELEVFKLPRKLNRMRYRSGNVLAARSKSVQIANAEKVASVPVKCISVDSPDRQFLFGETMLPTHNSTIAAGIMLTELILNERESGEFIILAPTKEVADNAYKPIRDMIRNDEELTDMFQVQDHIRTVTHRVTHATLKVVAADSSTVSGKKAIGVLVDELWEFGKNPSADNMLLEATGGLASRPEGFVIYLTTQSDTPPAGVFSTKLKYAREVRDGEVEDSGFLAVLYEHPKTLVKKDEHLKPENFYMTNPNMGKSVTEEYLFRKFAQAQKEDKKSLAIFLAKHANVEIGMALRADRWAGADYWEKTADPKANFDWILRNCEVVTSGGDGGGLDDLLGLSFVGRRSGSKEWVSWSHAWAHHSVLERRKQEAARLMDFEKQGDLTIVDRIGDDSQEFADYVARVHAADLLYQLGLDPSGIGSIIDDLLEAKVPEDKIIGVSQGWKLGGAIKTTERKLADGSLLHCDQPLMNWCVGNAKVEPRANSILITKQVSGSGKIDPLMALFNAVTLMSLNPPAQKNKYQMLILG